MAGCCLMKLWVLMVHFADHSELEKEVERVHSDLDSVDCIDHFVVRDYLVLHNYLDHTPGLVLVLDPGHTAHYYSPSTYSPHSSFSLPRPAAQKLYALPSPLPPFAADS
jgi:hypothetical protein